MTIPVQFDTPLVIDATTGETTETAEILAIHDEASLAKITARVQLRAYPGLYETITLYDFDDYEALGDWSYAEIAERTKEFFFNEWQPQASLVPEATEEASTSEAEASEAEAEPLPSEEPVPSEDAATPEE